MADHPTTTEFEGFNKSNEKNLDIKTKQRRLLMLEETVHESIEIIEKMERKMHLLVEKNYILKTR